MPQSKRAEDFGDDLAARRKWLESLPHDRVRITTTPTRKRLRAANDNIRLAALEAADALMAHHAPECLPDPVERLDAAAVGNGWRMRPETSEIERAMAGRVAVRSAEGRTHAERSRASTVHIGDLTFTRTRRMERAPVLVMGDVAMGDVLVPANSMIGRGRTAKGGSLKPAEYRTYERPDGEVKKRAELAGKRAITSYLELRGSWDDYESWADRVSGVPRVVERPAAAADLAAAYANTPVLPAVTKCPDGYWWRGHWLGGVTQFSGLSRGHDGHAQRSQDSAMRILVQRWLTERLSGDELRILALATSSATADEAGAEVGMTRQRFVCAANDALDKVANLLAA